MIMCAFKTLAMQRSHSDVKSAAVTAGGGLAQASSPMLAQTSPLNTLANVRETGEVGGGEGEGLGSWHPAGPAVPPSTTKVGEAGLAEGMVG